MKEITVSLPDQETIKSFCATVSTLPGDFELVQGRTILDARSLMGIFSLDLDMPMTLRMSSDDPGVAESFTYFKD